MAITEFPIPTKILAPADYPEFKGDAGDPGADGKTILNGVVAPTTEGVDGDFYIDTVANLIYGPKAAGVWGSGTSLVGPEGDPGIQGDPGDPGIGVPVGGTIGQVLAKASATDYDTAWTDQSSGAEAPLTLASGTITASEPALNITQTWNGVGVTFEGVTVNITDTASATGSRLLDLKVGANRVMEVRKNGNIGIFRSNALVGSVTDRNAGIGLQAPNNLSTFGVFNSFVAMSNGMHIGWADGANPDGGGDLQITRDAANTLAQRRGTNAQTFRIYNTFTDASNYERFAIRWNANTLELNTEAAGTGTLRDMSIAPSGGKLAFLGATPVAQQAQVADADTAHALNATFSDTEVEAALNALGTKLNSVLATLRAFGLLATS